MKKIVLDPSVWMKYFLHQQESKLAKMIVQHQLCIFYSTQLLEEIDKIASSSMVKKYQVNAIHIASFIKLAATYYAAKDKGVYYIPTDKGDNYIISLAAQTKSILVSDDVHIAAEKDKLNKSYRQKVLSIEEFEQQFNLDNTMIF